MKKNRLFMIMLAVMMTGIMAFAFAGCAQQDEQTEEQTEEQTTEAVDDSFNLAEALSDTDILETLDASGVDYYVQQDSNVSESFCLSACAEDSEYDGMVGFISAYEEGDTSYEDIPDHRVIGEKDGMTYVVCLATDARYDTEDPQQCSDFEKLTEALKSIEIK